MKLKILLLAATIVMAGSTITVLVVQSNTQKARLHQSQQEAPVAEGVRVVAAVPAAAAAPVDPAAFPVPAGVRNTYFKCRAIGKTLVLVIKARASFQGVVSLIDCDRIELLIRNCFSRAVLYLTLRG